MIDYKSYEQLWELGIRPMMQKYVDNYAGMIIDPDAKKNIWEEYCSFNAHCKSVFMEGNEDRIDRHKVCACYIYAIVKAHVMTNKEVKDNDKFFLLANEYMAITVGLSLLRAFIIQNTISNENLDRSVREKTLKQVEGGIILPECNHGKYINNFATELYYTRLENNYNILSLAHSLFLLEIHTTQTEVLKKRGKKKTH